MRHLHHDDRDEDGEAKSLWRTVPRVRLGFAIGTTMLGMPVVVLDNLPSSAEPAAVVTAAPSSTTTLPPPTSTTVDVALLAPPTTVPPTTVAPTTTTAPPATTTTTRPPPPPTTTPPPPPPPVVGASQSGEASWYYWRTGECAHRTLALGTIVTITNDGNGATATCTVTDRGPYGEGRIIDLDRSVFSQLAPLSAGVIDVTITW